MAVEASWDYCPSTLEFRQEPRQAKKDEAEGKNRSERKRDMTEDDAARVKAIIGEEVVGTFDVCILTFDGGRWISHNEVTLAVCQELDCDVIEFLEIRQCFALETTEECTRGKVSRRTSSSRESVVGGV